MSPNARKAFEELKKIGAPVMEWSEQEGYGPGVVFVMIWANDDSSQVFADIDGRRINEEFRDGRFINPHGYRQDVHEIFARYDLVTAWHNHGQVVVYDDPDATGFRHSTETR